MISFITGTTPKVPVPTEMPPTVAEAQTAQVATAKLAGAAATASPLSVKEANKLEDKVNNGLTEKAQDEVKTHLDSLKQKATSPEAGKPAEIIKSAQAVNNAITPGILQATYNGLKKVERASKPAPARSGLEYEFRERLNKVRRANSSRRGSVDDGEWK